MERVYKSMIIFVMMFVAGVSFASGSSPMDVDDTIPADIRYENYYYTKWFDECPNYYPNGGVVDSCFCKLFELWNFYGDASVAKWEHTNQRMRVKGLVAMVDRLTPPDAVDSNLKLPEYMYLYQLVGRHHALLSDIEDGLDLVLLDSVRWDTVSAPRVMELRRGWNGEYTQYCYLYEAYFEQPVYVDSDFYIYGSTNSNVFTYPGSHIWRYYKTRYVDVMNFPGWNMGYIFNDKECEESHAYDSLIHYENMNPCKPQGGWVALIDQMSPELGWITPWPDSPWGYYLPIVDQWNLDAVPADSAFGEVLGGGRYPDGTYDTIYAMPAPGCYFHSWNDSVTDNPRVIYLTSDTTFVAIFYGNEMYTLDVSSSDETMGTVTGGGSYHGATDNPIAATPNYGYLFDQWNDGVTDNPRVVHLVSDTSFVAYFVEKPYYNVQTATNNDEWGTVEGGGIYMDGEEATLNVTTAPFCVFEGWADGDWHLPRSVTVTQDTLFTAILSFDSAWASGIEKVGSLDFTASPNPTTGRLTIRMGQSGKYDITVYDMGGKVMVSESAETAETEVDVSVLPSGKYLLLVRSRDNYGIKKIVKK